jgi:hypothetical protein
MRHSILIVLAVFAFSSTAHGFGHKKMNVTELKGVTETQLVRSGNEKKLSVMIRGKGAELLYRTLKERRSEHVESAALDMIGTLNNTHWTVHGKQVSCSRIQAKNYKGKNKAAGVDYACAFELDTLGLVTASVEPFNPSLFNMVNTKTYARLFPAAKHQPSRGRSLASTSPVPVPYGASAYLMHELRADGTTAKRDFQDTMVVFRGPAAAEIMSFLAQGKRHREFTLAGAKGVRGREISCVQATGSEPDRCALVFSLKSGSVSTWKNPLFR